SLSLDRVIVPRRSSEEQSCRLDRLDPVTGYAGARRLPRGWTHLLLQIAVWFGFYVAYQAARGAADRGVGEAFWNGTLVIETENRLRLFFESTSHNIVERGACDRGRNPARGVLRADHPELRRAVGRPHRGHDLHLLALPVRRRRHFAPVGVLQAPRELRGLPES